MDYNHFWLPLLLTIIAGLSTVLGNLITFIVKDFKKTYLQFFLGMSAGVMIYISFADLLPTSISEIGSISATVAFFSGMLIIMVIDFLIPHEYIEEHIKKNTGKDSKLMMAGIFTAIGITIHNIPEGLAVFISASNNIQMGFRVAFAIMIHNIPEGIAIAVPIYCATKCRSKAIKYSLLSGIAEPAGALLGILLLGPFLNMFVLHFSLAVVAGIMIFISFDELLPLSFEHEKNHVPMFGIIIGMLIMAFSIHFF